MARPRTHDEALRLKLLDRAGELIAADGPKALSLRKLAGDCICREDGDHEDCPVHPS